MGVDGVRKGPADVRKESTAGPLIALLWTFHLHLTHGSVGMGVGASFSCSSFPGLAPPEGKPGGLLAASEYLISCSGEIETWLKPKPGLIDDGIR
ncbi:hypothetical protein F4781DRAFT_434492 [Annulohypoxylon bovei var. microspora]|nr:hypothetical protein F4781DRAFT_434492 [Annulohypoxylon bovei var. microspora]